MSDSKASPTNGRGIMIPSNEKGHLGRELVTVSIS